VIDGVVLADQRKRRLVVVSAVLWWWSARCRRTCCCCFASSLTAFLRRLLPFFCRRDTRCWAFLSRCSAVR
jgi:hypothetical protein